MIRKGQWQFINRADTSAWAGGGEVGTGRDGASLQRALAPSRKTSWDTGRTWSPEVSGRQTPGTTELGQRGFRGPSGFLQEHIFLVFFPQTPRSKLTSNSPGGTCPQFSLRDPGGSSEPPGLEGTVTSFFFSVLREASSLRPRRSIPQQWTGGWRGEGASPQRTGSASAHPSFLIPAAFASPVAISFMSYKCNIWEMKAVINTCLPS